jgi:hypothetical protein
MLWNLIQPSFSIKNQEDDFLRMILQDCHICFAVYKICVKLSLAPKTPITTKTNENLHPDHRRRYLPDANPRLCGG